MKRISLLLIAVGMTVGCLSILGLAYTFQSLPNPSSPQYLANAIQPWVIGAVYGGVTAFCGGAIRLWLLLSSRNG